jgi:predicted nuclease of predicted toxin-antitoxin system
MRILLDENLPRKLARHFIGHECRTVVECGWSGKKNGELLAEADLLFDLLLTLDKNLPYQQDLTTKRIAVLIVRARSNRIQDLLPILPECLAALGSIQPQQVVRVGSFTSR